MISGLPAILFLSIPGSAASEIVAVKAGTIHAVGDGLVLEGGATILIEDGRIAAIGKDLPIPPGVRVVDYGIDAVITPGLVTADSTFGEPRPSERTADPSVMAVDGFDPHTPYVFALQEGVTAAYLAPARGRLIAGQGAVVKLAGRSDTGGAGRVLSASAAIHGAVSDEARHTPGYWEPPLPATVDVGMGVEEPQLPRTLMGAIVALDELVELARRGEDSARYGPGVGTRLRELIDAGRPWRMVAVTEPEIRALLGFFSEKGLPLVIDGAHRASAVAEEIARAGFPVIVEAPVRPNAGGRDVGRGRDVEAPPLDVASRLDRAHVRFAITPADSVGAKELRFAAAIASRGGLARESALRAITLSPAEILGVADRIGSLEPGKDADLAVFNGHPLEGGTSTLATWIDGEIVYKRSETAALVLSVDELHLGDGEILSPGEILVTDGRIREVGRRVGRPGGAEIVRGKAAMPGMIDALGHLGLGGSNRVPATRFDLVRIVDAGDRTARRVARAGITTVVLSPRGSSRTGAPMLAYKPAASDHARMLVSSPAALRFQWNEKNRLDSGDSLREILSKATAYAKKWDEYEKKMAEWKPPEEGKAVEDGEKKKEAGAKESEGAEKEAGEQAKPEDEKKEGADGKDDKKKADEERKKGEEDKKKKKKKGEEEPAEPITGAWETQIVIPPFETARLRLYVLDEDGKITGSLRCASLSDGLIAVAGTRAEKKVTLSGEGSRGKVTLDVEQKDGKLEGKLVQGAASVEISLEQKSTEYEIAKRPERRKVKEEKKEVKGQPRSPGIDPDLEPLRRAMKGDAAVVVGVDREDEILACVEAFEGAGIKPILLGAKDAWKVADRLRGRVAGVMLDQLVTATEPKSGAKERNRYAEMAEAGIPVAFHSDAEDGAADLPAIAAYAVSQGMSAEAAFRALTFDAARMYAIDERVGRIAPGLDADVLLLDGSPLDISTQVIRVWVAGEEVR